ncbi:MAG: hypothetical protein WCW44_03185 [archaeon]|jgi:hypothetical protein
MPSHTVRKGNAQGFVATKNGNFNIRAPVIPKVPYIPREARLNLVLSSAPSRAIAGKFGVGQETILRWRKCLATTLKEKPTVMERIASSAGAHELAKMFYERGGNKLRRRFELSKRGTDGLLIALAIYGYLPLTREQYITNVISARVHQRSLGAVQRTELIKSIQKEYDLPSVAAKSFVDKILPNRGVINA